MEGLAANNRQLGVSEFSSILASGLCGAALTVSAVAGRLSPIRWAARREARVSLFEYLAAAYTLILSFAVARLIGGLPDSIVASRRYWVHLAFIAGAFSMIATTFWNFWSFRAADWTFARFLLVLMSPVVLQYMAATLIPASPDQVESWREFYYSIRQRYFVSVIAFGFLAGLDVILILDFPLLHPSMLGVVGGIATGVIGVYSDNPRVHAGLGLSALVLLPAAVFVLFAQPVTR